MYHYESCGLENVWLKNGYTERATKYGPAVSIDDLEGLHKMLALRIVEVTRALTPGEFRFLRIELDLSQRGLGDLLGSTDQTVANYEKGNTNIQRLADTTLRCLYQESVDVESRVGEMLNRLVELDNHRAAQEKFELEFDDNVWHEAAAA